MRARCPYLSPKLETVRWDEYFRHPRYKEFSAFDFLMKNRAFRWALWLLIALFALIFLFESKRKQRQVPIIPPLRNSSVEFVRTIGRLYYQQKNNRNLADKMIVFFMEQVRSKYRLGHTVNDGQFAVRSCRKIRIFSGHGKRARRGHQFDPAKIITFRCGFAGAAKTNGDFL